MAPDIPDKEPNPVVALELLRHVPLFHLVARIYDNFSGVVLGQGHGDKGVPKRTGPAGNKDCFVWECAGFGLVGDLTMPACGVIFDSEQMF